MSLRDRWAEAREHGRQDREALRARDRCLVKRIELEKLGVPAGEVREDLAEEALDAMLAAEKQRQAAM